MKLVLVVMNLVRMYGEPAIAVIISTSRVILTPGTATGVALSLVIVQPKNEE
jgi:hypothetical protein